MSLISDSQLVLNVPVRVRGTIVFSRIASRLEGEALEKHNANQRYPKGPHTTITIAHANIVPISGTDVLNINEQYVKDKFFVSKLHPEDENRFSVDNTGKFLPTAFQGTPGSNEIAPVVLENEPKVGLDVTVVVRFYKTQYRTSMALDKVIFNDLIEYAATNTADLTAMGYTIVGSANVPAAIDYSNTVASADISSVNNMPPVQNIQQFTQPQSTFAQPAPTMFVEPQPVYAAAPAQQTPVMQTVAPQTLPPDLQQAYNNLQRPIRTY